MAEEKKKPRFFQKIIETHHVLGKEVTCQKLSAYIGGNPLLTRIEIETNRAFRKDILLQRLAQFAFEGKIAQVASLVNIRPDLRREVLFTLAGLGAQDEMEALLRQHPEDLLVVRPLRDISGAEFEPISLFQHCLWTKDVRYMANMMLDCLPKNEIGEAIRLELVRQYEEHMAKGASYQLKGERHENERHFNVQPLITALRTSVENRNYWTEPQKEKHWCAVVGLAQTLIPAHIRHHYCDSEVTFWYHSNFNTPNLKRSLEFYNWIWRKSQVWSESLIGLGSEFGILGCYGAAARRAEGDPDANLAALTNLDKERTNNDLPALVKRLYIPIQKLEDNLVQRVGF